MRLYPKARAQQLRQARQLLITVLKLNHAPPAVQKFVGERRFRARSHAFAIGVRQVPTKARIFGFETRDFGVA